MSCAVLHLVQSVGSVVRRFQCYFFGLLLVGFLQSCGGGAGGPDGCLKPTGEDLSNGSVFENTCSVEVKYSYCLNLNNMELDGHACKADPDGNFQRAAGTADANDPRKLLAVFRGRNDVVTGSDYIIAECSDPAPNDYAQIRKDAITGELVGSCKRYSTQTTEPTTTTPVTTTPDTTTPETTTPETTTPETTTPETNPSMICYDRDLRADCEDLDDGVFFLNQSCESIGMVSQGDTYLLGELAGSTEEMLGACVF